MSKVNIPSYYQSVDNNQDAIDVIKEFDLNFNLGNVFKYIVRKGKKTEDSLGDLRKASEYIKREIMYLSEKLEQKCVDVICLPESTPLKGLNPMEVLGIMLNAAEIQSEHPEIREGQAMYIATHKQYPKHALRAQGVKGVDPFNIDKNVDAFVKFIMNE